MKSLKKLSICFMALILSSLFFACQTEVASEVTRYTVTYSSGHGTAPGTITVDENTVLSENQLPTISTGGLTFKGWYDGDVKVVAGEYHVTKNTTLTALWASTATVSCLIKTCPTRPSSRATEST